MRHEPESRLILLARAGNASAGEELARRHMPTAWRAAYAITGRRELADDALQDGLERAFRSLGRVDATRPFAPWLHRIVVNCALDVLKSRRRLAALSEDAHSDDGGLENALGARQLREALCGISPDRRAVVVLRVVLGYSPEECAQMLGVAVGTVHSRLSRALADLRGLLEVPGGA